VILRFALLLVAAAGLAASGCATQRGGDSASPPRATLAFFGLRPDMTVVEVWPGGGYTEILAPLLKQHGRLYEAHLDPASSEYSRRTVDEFRAKLSARPDLYDKPARSRRRARPTWS